ncbi:MAG: hypothetical protein RMN25_08070 [Anaerolineae bacterium]|nr:hypothetical protein [Thermoflexales bacterium]MDW8407728.1 hypothetical protein [Anaerolineae bacterium]
MNGKKWIAAIGAAALIAIGAAAAGPVLAQSEAPSTTPTTPQSSPYTGKMFRGFGFGFWGGSTAQFDAVAKALNLTPTQLFEQLHSGKTLEQIAQAQGVDMQTVINALNAARIQALKDQIAQAVADGKITQEQADWMIQGIEKGYMPFGRGFGKFGGRGHGRGWWMPMPNTPATPTPDTSSSSS